jgi:hypothetical protein
LVLDFYSTLLLITGLYLLWNIVWYGWHIGAIGAKGVLPVSPSHIAKEFLFPFVTVVVKRRFPTMFYYEDKGRVLIIPKFFMGDIKLGKQVCLLFIIGRVLQSLSGEWFVPIRRWFEIIAKWLFIFSPVLWWIGGKPALAWDLFIIVVLLLFVAYWDTDGYIRALIMYTQQADLSEEIQDYLHSLRFYPFSLFLVLRTPLDIIAVVGGRNKSG